ncbi:hypothetical protein EDB84DRAFT_211442 [Lactarius hengduanensis]|nr:hypothetical protein EDB84DRAFT_211442 [Lactarius hengduanensis]
MPRKSLCPFQASSLTDSIYFSIYEESDGRGRHNRPFDGRLRLLPSPPFSPRFFSESPCSTPHGISYSLLAPLSAANPAVDLSSTRISAFSPASRQRLLPVYVAVYGRTCYSTRCIIWRINRASRLPSTRLTLAAVSHRPWLSTSLHEFWSYRWHQLFRHIFVTFGARPGGALLGQPARSLAHSLYLRFCTTLHVGDRERSEFSTAGDSSS